ncbi:MAG: molybdopterin-dependent oxidoreductase, partial [Acidobacteriia bacterium]|nr:molybdopterin-dependent oxidoreductase [Terriglobia bacterium]
MYPRRSLLLAILGAGVLAAQEPQTSIEIAGAVKQPLTLTADDLAKMPRATVRTMNNGMETVYEGVWLHEILKKAGVPQGNELRGKALSSYVVAEAQDGYQVVFSLEELDPAFLDNEILL